MHVPLCVFLFSGVLLMFFVGSGFKEVTARAELGRVGFKEVMQGRVGQSSSLASLVHSPER